MATVKKPTISIKNADYPHLPAASFKKILDFDRRNGMSDRKIVNDLLKHDRVFAEVMNQPNVEQLIITIDWYDNRTWGKCPKASYRVRLANGKYMSEENAASAKGCGYDKESTVVASIFNMFCKGMAYRKLKTAAGKKSKPYGVYTSEFSGCYFDGGIGMSCYREIATWLGGKMEDTAHTRNADVYTFTFKKRK